MILNLTNHAYVIIGSSSERINLIDILSKNHKISSRANPDFFDRTYETFAIDDARDVKAFHETKPMNAGAKKVFILTMNGITVEAQNALLKLLEEPAEYAHFLIIIPSSHLLLPTVKSRVQLIENDKKNKDESDKTDAKKFIQSSSSKRLDQIKNIVDEISKDKATKQAAIDFLNDVQEVLYEEKGVKAARQSLEAIEHARKYMNDRSPSIKMLLEYVALNF